ncbi:MAG TPA: hypothetical protein VFR47_12475 [Anaerolineales bacterium]|nr:hypothetical protein [Anaerolineales bacterium]
MTDKEQDSGYNHAREEETETTRPGKTQTPAADQTGSPQGKCAGSGIEKKNQLSKNGLGHNVYETVLFL